VAIPLVILLAVLRPTSSPTPGALEQGEVYLQHKQYAAAETALKRAIEADPGSARAHGNLALALLAQRKTKEAVAEARLAVAFGPDSAEAHYIFGLTLSADGHPIDAARQYEQAVALKPGEAGPQAALAAAYAAVEDPRTRAAYECLSALRPKDFRPRADLADYLWRTAKLEDGNTVMVEAIAAFPSEPGLPARYGRALAQQERLLDAAAALEAARQLGATDASSMALLAKVYEEAGRVADAQGVLADAVAIHPDDAALAHDLGRLWLAEGRVDEAFTLLERAATAVPGSAEYALDYGRALEARGNLEQAEAAYRSAVRLSPNLPRAHYALGRLLQREGKKDEAERELAAHHALYERARQIVAANTAADARASLAWSELNAGRASQALQLFQALPESPDSLKGQALACQRLGRHAEAVQALEKARSLSPEDGRLEILLVAEKSQAEAAR
jgi:tetratricopeptide (TPR) repeat protein